MFYCLKNLLLVLISICAFQNTAQPSFGANFDDKYTITIGNKQITPTKNVHTYATLKKELANNLHEGYYHVLIQFNDEPDMNLKSQMAGKIINKIAISNNTYIASVTKNINTRKLKNLNVRAILALSPEMKIKSAVLESDKEIIKVNIVTSNNLKEGIVFDQLKKYDTTFELKFIANSVYKYTYYIEKSKLHEIAELPWVLQIDEGGMK